MFGGEGFDEDNQSMAPLLLFFSCFCFLTVQDGRLCDLWRFNTSDGIWHFVSGSTKINVNVPGGLFIVKLFIVLIFFLCFIV